MNQSPNYWYKTTHAQILNLPSVLMICEFKAIHGFSKENAAYEGIVYPLIYVKRRVHRCKTYHLFCWFVNFGHFTVSAKEMQRTIESVTHLLIKSHTCTNTKLTICIDDIWIWAIHSFRKEDAAYNWISCPLTDVKRCMHMKC